jgi:hypothetical protein
MQEIHCCKWEFDLCDINFSGVFQECNPGVKRDMPIVYMEIRKDRVYQPFGAGDKCSVCSAKDQDLNGPPIPLHVIVR